MLDVSGNVSINKKKFGIFTPQKNIEVNPFGIGIKPKEEQIDHSDKPYEEVAGFNELDTKVFHPEKIQSEPLRIEFQLDTTEKSLRKVKDEIKKNKKLNMEYTPESQKLREREARLQKKYTQHRKEYRDLGVSYKIIDSITQVKNVTFEGISTLKDDLKQNPLVKSISQKATFFQAKNTAETAGLLNEKLAKEIVRPVGSSSRNIEPFLLEAEKIKTKSPSGIIT